jgi:two-component system cell cycle sensor histidine kinase/response regulator CckA
MQGYAPNGATDGYSSSHEMLSHLVEACPVGIIAVGHEGRVTIWNPAAERIFGWPRQDVLGSKPPVVPDSAAPGLWAAELPEHCLSGREMRLSRRDGSLIDVAVSTALLRMSEREPGGLMATITDISERKESERAAEEQRRLSQRLESVGLLAGGVAHDFNNVLTAIKGYCAMIQQELPQRSPMAEDLLEINKAANRAADLTRQLLAFSRRQVIQPRLVDLNGIVRDLERMLRRLIGEDIDLRVQLDTTPLRIVADPGQLEQVIVNLIVNARDAMPEGPRHDRGAANPLRAGGRAVRGGRGNRQRRG